MTTLRFTSPVGTPEQRAASPARLLVGDWVDATPFATYYHFGEPVRAAYHTGADLNLNKPFWNADAHQPVYAAADGVVTCAKEFRVWGMVIVIRHQYTDEDGTPQTVYSRYAHVEQLLINRGTAEKPDYAPAIKAGDEVKQGQQIARVGNAGGQQPYHLHFDISPTDILETQPEHWSGTNFDELQKNYVDPAKFIRAQGDPRRAQQWYVPGITAVRAAPTIDSQQLRTLAAGQIVWTLAYEEDDPASDYFYLPLADEAGYVAKQLLKRLDEMPVEDTLTFYTDGYVNVRTQPTTASAILTTLAPNTKVLCDPIEHLSAKDGFTFLRLTGQPGYIAKKLLLTSPAPATLTLYTDGYVNKRALPSTKSAVVTTLDPDTEVIVEAVQYQSPDNNFTFSKCVDGSGFIASYLLKNTPSTPKPPTPLPLPTPTWSLPFAASTYGAHANAGGWKPTAKELDIVRASDMQLVLIPTFEPDKQDQVGMFRQAGVRHFIIRAAIHGGGETAAKFIEITLPRLKQYAAALGTSKEMLIALHNEPNLQPEGCYKYWNNGAQYANWHRQVAAAYRKELPGCRIGLAALSPGGALGNLRYDEASFVSEMKKAGLIEECDWIGVHCYWQRKDGIDFNPPLARWREWFGSKPLVATEVGPVDNPAITATASAHRYARNVLRAAGISTVAFILNGAGSFANADLSLVLPGGIAA